MMARYNAHSFDLKSQITITEIHNIYKVFYALFHPRIFLVNRKQSFFNQNLILCFIFIYYSILIVFRI